MTEEEKVRVMGVVGSPRRGGNTEILVDEVLAGAREAGAISKKAILNEMDVNPCQACNECHRTGRCVQEDDMLSLIEHMKESEVRVLGTSVYWWGPTAQFKAFIDRWYGLNREMFRGKRVILAIPLGGGSDSYAKHTTGMLTDILDYLGAERYESLIATGSHGPGSIRGRTVFMNRARETGREAVISLR